MIFLLSNLFTELSSVNFSWSIKSIHSNAGMSASKIPRSNVIFRTPDGVRILILTFPIYSKVTSANRNLFLEV